MFLELPVPSLVLKTKLPFSHKRSTRPERFVLNRQDLTKDHDNSKLMITTIYRYMVTEINCQGDADTDKEPHGKEVP
jgi:hypothetical protein